MNGYLRITEIMQSCYEEMFGDRIEADIASELAHKTLHDLYDIQQNNDAECTYAPYSAGQIDCAIFAYEQWLEEI